MALYLYRLGRFAARRAWAVVLVWILLFASVAGAAAVLQKPFTSELSIPGTEFQTVLDDLDQALPSSAGGTAPVVFSTSGGAPFTQEQKNAVARTAAAWSKVDGVDDATNPFGTQQDLDEGRADLVDGREKLADGERAIRQNRAKIADGKKELANGREKLDTNEKKLIDGQAQLAGGQGKLADGEARLASGKAQLANGEAEIAANEAKLTQGRAQLDQAQAKIDAGRPQLQAGRDRLDAGQRQLDAGKAKLADGERQLAQGRQQVQAGEALAAPAKKQLADGERRIAQARAGLAEGRQKLRQERAKVADGRRQLARATAQADALAEREGEDDPRVVEARGRIATQKAELAAGDRALDATEATLARGATALEAQDRQLAAGKRQLAERTAPLEEARRTIEEKGAQVQAGRRALAANQSKIDTGRATLAQKAKELEAGQQKLTAGRAQLDAGQAKLDAGKAKLDQGKAEITKNEAKLDAGQAEIGANEAKLTSGQARIAQGRVDLQAAATQLRSGEAKLKDGASTIAEKKVELRRGERRLALMDGMRAVNEDGDVAMANVTFDGPVQEVTPETRDALYSAASGLAADGVEVDYSQDISEEIAVGGASEAVGLVVAAVILLIMLGSLLAAGLPLLIALVGVGVGMLGVLVVTHWVEMTDVTPALAVMLGLAVGIDYALFIVHRHRETLVRGDVDVQESIGRATGTAGTAVLFAGMTVFIALAALTLAGIPFLGVMGLAAAGTVAAAVVVALTLTPAILSIMGIRVLSRKGRRLLARHRAEHEAALEAGDESPRGSTSNRAAIRAERGTGWGGFVTRHPLATLFVSVALLGTLAIPTASLTLGLPDASQASHDSTGYRTYEKVADGFGPGQNAAILAVAKVDKNEARRLSDGQVTDLQLTVGEHLKDHDGVEYVVPAAVSDDHRTLVFQIVPTSGPNDPETQDLIHDLRDHRSEVTDTTAVDSLGFAGQTVANIDMSELLGAALPKYLAVVVGISIILLLLVFRSIIVPLLATGGFLLSVGASFGAVVAVYQWGWLGSLFGVEEPGVILSFLPTLVIGILFGLAMDYQMFLVSGMREAWAHGDPARLAVRNGFSQGAKVVTAAALIMTGVFASFMHAPMTMIRPIGFALAVGVLLDAFVVRMTIMPAVMHLLGEKAWFLPRPLARILPDLDVEGTKLVEERERVAQLQAEAEEAETVPMASPPG